MPRPGGGYYVLPRGRKDNFPAIVESTPPCLECGAPFEPICPTASCQGRKVPLAIEIAEKRELGDRRDWLIVAPGNLGSGVKEPKHWSGPRVRRILRVTELPDDLRDEAA